MAIMDKCLHGGNTPGWMGERKTCWSCGKGLIFLIVPPYTPYSIPLIDLSHIGWTETLTIQEWP